MRFEAGGAARAVLKAVAALLFLLLLLLAGLRVGAAIREKGAAAPPDLTMVATPLGEVAVHLSGPPNGIPVLLVHGSAGWSGFWRDVSRHLAGRGWRVAAVDLPPFGWSERDPHARYDRVAQAERLSAVLAALGPRRAAVVAHSFGAGAAAELALRHPERLSSLVMVDAALGRLDPAPGRGAAASLLGFRPLAEAATAATLTNPRALGSLLRPMLARKETAAAWLPVLRRPMRREGTTSAYAAWLPNLLARDEGGLSRRSEALRSLAMPVALIWGEADTVTPLDQGRGLAALTRPRSFAVLPGVGHIPHIEDPEAFLAALDAALAPDREGR